MRPGITHKRPRRHYHIVRVDGPAVDYRTWEPGQSRWSDVKRADNSELYLAINHPDVFTIDEEV